jgi:hypothetical protein
LRRIFVRLQGAPRGAYYLYVTFGATLKAGKKTSKMADLFVSEALYPFRIKQKGRIMKDPAFLFIRLSKMPLFSCSEIFTKFGSPAEEMHAHPRN